MQTNIFFLFIIKGFALLSSFSLLFPQRFGTYVLRTSRRTYWLKRCGNIDKDEHNSPKTLNDKTVKLRLRNSNMYVQQKFIFVIHTRVHLSKSG